MFDFNLFIPYIQLLAAINFTPTILSKLITEVSLFFSEGFKKFSSWLLNFLLINKVEKRIEFKKKSESNGFKVEDNKLEEINFHLEILESEVESFTVRFKKEFDAMIANQKPIITSSFFISGFYCVLLILFSPISDLFCNHHSKNFFYIFLLLFIVLNLLVHTFLIFKEKASRLFTIIFVYIIINVILLIIYIILSIKYDITSDIVNSIYYSPIVKSIIILSIFCCNSTLILYPLKFIYIFTKKCISFFLLLRSRKKNIEEKLKINLNKL